MTEECKIKVANPFPGIYYITNDIYPVQIIVPEKLPPEKSLYLRCLTDRLTDKALIERLAADYSLHQEQAMYVKYMNQLTRANISKEGASTMYCEGIFEMYGTSSQEIAEKAAEKAARQAHEEDSAILQKTTSELERLRALLDLHNIAYK